MTKSSAYAETIEEARDGAYQLDKQIGYLLRRAHQRHVGIFATMIGDSLTPQQFAVLARLGETVRMSQNELGRQTAMDQSTMNGVVQRLLKRGLIARQKCDKDKRMILLTLTDEGQRALARTLPAAREISDKTLEPLGRAEQAQLLRLLHKLC